MNEDRKHNKSVKKNIIYNALKTFSSLVFPFVTFPYVSRTLLPEYIGKISFSTSYVGYFALIASLGVSTYAIRECSVYKSDKNKLGQLASELFTINLCSTVIAYVLLFLSLLLFSNLKPYVTLVSIQSISIICTTIGADYINSAVEDFKYITIRTFLFQALSLILMFTFVKKPGDYMKYAVILLISSSGANIVNIVYRQKYCKIGFTFHSGLKKHILPILYLFVMVLAQSIFNNADMTMLGLFKGDYEVGLYSASVKITSIISQMIFSVLWVILPRLSQYFSENNYKHINFLLDKIFGAYALLAFPCAAGVLSLSDQIILLIAGKEFLGASICLKILMFSFIFTMFGGGFAGNLLLLPAKKEKYFMFVCCVSAILNVLLNLCIIPVFGAGGAAFTTAICNLIMMIMLILKIDKNIVLINAKHNLALSITGSWLMLLIVYSFKELDLNLAVTIIFSAVFYFAFQLICKNDVIIYILNELKNNFRKGK